MQYGLVATLGPMAQLEFTEKALLLQEPLRDVFSYEMNVFLFNGISLTVLWCTGSSFYLICSSFHTSQNQSTAYKWVGLIFQKSGRHMTIKRFGGGKEKSRFITVSKLSVFSARHFDMRINQITAPGTVYWHEFMK